MVNSSPTIVSRAEGNFINKKEVKISKRKDNIELLRIISMLMIVTTHYLLFAGIYESNFYNSLNYFLSWIIEAFCYVAVNCYVLISGYFLINSNFKLKKLVSLWGEVFFYSLGIYLVLCLVGFTKFSFFEFLKASIPLISQKYWFATIYVGMYVISPILNIAIKSLTKKQLQYCLIVMFFIFSLLPNIFFFSDPFGVNSGYGIIWFICLYFLAAYIRLYYVPNGKRKFWFWCYFAFSLLLALSKFIIANLTKVILGHPEGSSIFYQYSSLIVLFAATSIFILFLNINIKNPNTIGLVRFFSKYTFGVYLIHTHFNFKNLLWSELVKPTEYLESNWLVIHLFLSVIIIYITCSLVELGRKFLFAKFGSWLGVENFWSSVQSSYKWNKVRLLIFKS
ncbi:acyltransferase [Neobacillus sp. PS2-9]|uniref:acyltransferase n=1 Tax=Neobacillus sp. PS2-9 TaxID=3070676 RepID=UPI0027E00E0A|nr:acyltransferase [Neobacillus sp. PS2-9]WML58625.1 acyltransferase [Neobacillus sp. PS2-9]